MYKMTNKPALHITQTFSVKVFSYICLTRIVMKTGIWVKHSNTELIRKKQYMYPHEACIIILYQNHNSHFMIWYDMIHVICNNIWFHTIWHIKYHLFIIVCKYYFYNMIQNIKYKFWKLYHMKKIILHFKIKRDCTCITYRYYCIIYWFNSNILIWRA